MQSASSFSSSTRPLASNAKNTQPVSRLPSLAGVAAEAECLQVAEVACAAPGCLVSTRYLIEPPIRL
jgi:hypothetical protein